MPLDGLDYRHTSVRPGFGSLPPEVRARISECAGSPVVVAELPVTSGFTRGYAGRLALADGRRVFAKAAGEEAPHARQGIALEASVLARLAGRATAPLLLGAAEVDDWRLVVLEAIDGQMPGMPWTDADADAVHDACVAAAALPPSVVSDLTPASLARDVGGDRDALAVLERLARAPGTRPGWMPGLGPVAAADLLRLGTLAEAALEGEHLVHGDLRPDNLLVEAAGGRARMVDWNWVARGPAWADFVGLWPFMARHGIDVTRFRGSPLLTQATDEQVDAFLAILVGYFIRAAEQDDGSAGTTALRAHQRAMAVVFTALLAGRRAWG
jgi:hypothetical protein